jgi:hypothetical protein
VVMEAYVTRLSTRSVDDLVAALGVDSGNSEPLWWGTDPICQPADEGAQCGAPESGHVDSACWSPEVRTDGLYLHAQFVGGELARERSGRRTGTR